MFLLLLLFERIPERDQLEGDEEDEFEMEGGEDDLEEFERAFDDDRNSNATRANGKSAGKKGTRFINKY